MPTKTVDLHVTLGYIENIAPGWVKARLRLHGLLLSRNLKGAKNHYERVVKVFDWLSQTTDQPMLSPRQQDAVALAYYRMGKG